MRRFLLWRDEKWSKGSLCRGASFVMLVSVCILLLLSTRDQHLLALVLAIYYPVLGHAGALYL